MSGAGRSAAADVLEDLGWYVVDNLPTSLVEKIVELASMPGSGIDRLALVAGRHYGAVLDNVAALRTAGHRVTVLFLDARRPSSSAATTPPVAGTRSPVEADGLVESIELERAMLAGTRDAADLVIDTTELNVHQLKHRLVAAFDDAADVPAAGRRRELRLQARAAARRRHRDGRAASCPTRTGRRPAPADRARPGGARLRARPPRHAEFLDRLDDCCAPCCRPTRPRVGAT